jgi:hypothetical protein
VVLFLRHLRISQEQIAIRPLASGQVTTCPYNLPVFIVSKTNQAFLPQMHLAVIYFFAKFALLGWQWNPSPKERD